MHQIDPYPPLHHMDTMSNPDTRRFRTLGKSVRNSVALKRAAAAIWMNILVGSVVGTATILTAHDPRPAWSIRALTVFAIWLLSFVPGWLYVRFLGQRADALWTEYVLNLYRLNLDDPRWLPPPPPESEYAARDGANEGGSERTNIYRQKFNAYYGRRISARSSESEDFRVTIETLFPVFLCTVTLATAWTATLWHPAVVMSPVEPWATLEYGFLGAYAFAISMLVRRFYQSDLRPSAYAAVVLRIVLVLLILAVLHQLFSISGADSNVGLGAQYITAFVVGFFPLAGLQALQRVAARVLHGVVPQLQPDYPLDQLDGLNVWYEARLIEEGVEDMQNLTTMNLVDVILHTRAPVGRLIDWIDQAFLLIHLEPVTSDEPEAAGSTRAALRRVGVRSATDLLRAFGGQPPLSEDAMTRCGLDPDRIAMLLRLLADEPGLNPVWSWRGGGPKRTPVPSAATTVARVPNGRSATRHRTAAPVAAGPNS
jgi:hypothetical protein